MREIVFAQTRCIDACLDLLKRQRDGEAVLTAGEPEVFRVVLTMIHMAGMSGHSILKLSDEVSLGARNTYPITRAIVEGVVNVCYIMAKGRETAERAYRHAEIKAYRDTRRHWDVGGMKMATAWSGPLPPQEIARLEAMLPEFTSKKGRELDWTGDTLKQRLNAISSAFPSTAMISLNASAFNVYRIASEVLHATYYSAIYFWGRTIPKSDSGFTKDEFRLTLMDHLFSTLSSTIFAYAGLLECFSSYVQMPELGKAAAKHLRQLAKLPAVAETLSAGEGAK
jgi:hypothetical protein